jgi:16S rRNA (cytidine1402-2'-O)-methyltransferase
LEGRQGGIRGEVTLLIGKPTTTARLPEQADLGARLEALRKEQKLDEKAALKKLAKELGIPKSEAYRRLQQSRKP